MDRYDSQSRYCYPGTNVLENKFFLEDQEKLNKAERLYTGKRVSELYDNPIRGNFNLKHLQKIHKYIFQDVYRFAGEIRDEQIRKDATTFAHPQYIESYSKQQFQLLKNEKHLKGLNVDDFSSRASYYMGEINMIHPFREGNGRAQREFIRTLAVKNGYELDWNRVDPERLLKASIRSVIDPKDLADVIRDSIINEQPDRFIMKLFEDRGLER
ncbi:Fic family protein [Cytobacillus firmus]|uniref:Fic/DOC family protein n=1 Tax=Cytobacillus firmus TaxID=1399 RepID=UPI00237A1353|nr:Fic family protein [Cytobacillus firmus]MDD9309822.1 Fic family protein [Cytobacillus firmus]